MLLTYKIVYTPNKDTKQSILDNSVNFLCSDDKIHHFEFKIEICPIVVRYRGIIGVMKCYFWRIPVSRRENMT